MAFARILLGNLTFGRHGLNGTGGAGKIHCDEQLLLV
jgi:hypothetical protein